MKNILTLAMAAVATLLLASCGRPVEQNEICLVMHTMGDRTKETSDSKEVAELSGDSEAVKRLRDNLLNARTELVYAKRAPLPLPGRIRIFFELGKHSYTFTGDKDFESPTNDEFVIDCLGGKIHFDFCVHMYIDRNQPDLQEKLLRLVQDYQLRQYEGEKNVLSYLVRDRFKRIIREPLQDYAAKKNPIDIIREKDKINAMALKYMNDQFGKYGIVFTMASIASPIRLEQAQREKMNAIVMKEYQREALALETGENGLKGLETRVEMVREEAKTNSAVTINEAKASVVRNISEANKRRRTEMIKLIGQDNYVNMETMLMIVKNLEDGKTSIQIVPDKSQIWMGLEAPVK